MGAFFGVANLFYPFQPSLIPPALATIVSRVADSFLYVPLVLGALCEMDDRVLARAQAGSAPTPAKQTVAGQDTGRGGQSLTRRGLALFGCIVALTSAVYVQVAITSFADGQLCGTHTAESLALHREACATVRGFENFLWRRFFSFRVCVSVWLSPRLSLVRAALSTGPAHPAVVPHRQVHERGTIQTGFGRASTALSYPAPYRGVRCGCAE